MSKRVVQFSEYKGFKEYNETLSEIHTWFDNLDEDIFNYCVQLAVFGKWKEWSDKQPVGSQVLFDDDMLREAGDSNIEMLLQLSDHIIDVRRKLKRKPGIPSRQVKNKAKENQKNKDDKILKVTKGLVDEISEGKLPASGTKTSKDTTKDSITSRHDRNVIVDNGTFEDRMHNKPNDKIKKSNSKPAVEEEKYQ